jgi:hypothetical protein
MTMLPDMAPPELDENRDGIAISGATETLPSYIQGSPPSIVELRRRADEARADPHGRRRKSVKARAYYDGPGQLDSEVRRVLDARKQPAIYTNRVRPAINGILGVLEQARSDPQAYPRNPQDQDSADVVTKVLRFVADQCDFGAIKQDVAENFWIEGCGATIVEMDGDDVVPTQIRWEEFYCDPYSRRNDRLDARYMGIAKWTDAEAIRSNPRWAGRLREIGDPMNPGGDSIFTDSYEDRGDTGAGWVNTKRRRVVLCEEYALEDGQWTRLVYVASGVLEYGPSPYLDEKGRPCNPIEAACCYVDENNGAYGAVDDMIPLADEINASRSRSLHLMNSRQVQYDPSSGAGPVDADTARSEAARADGVLPMGWSVIPTSDMTQANILRNQEAKAEIERMGPTPAVLGRQEGASQSGRARLVSQQAGLTELARPLGRLANWELRVYRQIWARVRQFKTDPWFVRVTDDERAPQWLQVNEPQMGMVMQPQVVGQDEMGEPIIEQMPAMGIVGYDKRLAQMDVDIILDTVPDTATLQQETWEQLVQLVGQGGGLAAVYTPAFELMIEASPLSDKRRVVDLIKRGREDQTQQQMQALQQQIQQLTEQLEQRQGASAQESAAKVERDGAQARKLGADADRTTAETAAMLGIDPLLVLGQG